MPVSSSHPRALKLNRAIELQQRYNIGARSATLCKHGAQTTHSVLIVFSALKAASGYVNEKVQTHNVVVARISYLTFRFLPQQ